MHVTGKDIFFRRVSLLQDHHQGIYIYLHTIILRSINKVYIR